MDSSGPSSSNAVNEGGGSQQQYSNNPVEYLSQARISNFVSIKLTGETNYYIWKKQMKCLLEYHDLVGFIDGTSIVHPERIKWNKSRLDTLVKGWIFGTLSEDLLDTVVHLPDAFTVWDKLEIFYDKYLKASVEGAKLYPDCEIDIMEENKVGEAKYIPLQRALDKADWDKAHEFFKKDPESLTAKITFDCDTPLHVAVDDTAGIHIVKNLLQMIDPNLLPTLVNKYDKTILHYAALTGNTMAAEMIVEINPSLLFIGNPDLPINMALDFYQTKTFLYLFRVSKRYIKRSQDYGYQNPFEAIQGSRLLCGAISQGFLDIAYELICEYPKLAISEDETETPLLYIVKNQDLYFSATSYNFYQRFIYYHVPIGKIILENDKEIPDIENPENCSIKGKRSCFYPVIKRIYVNIWKATLLHVPHIKCLQEDKLKHKKGVMILKRICKEIGTISKAGKIYNQYCGAFNVAVLKDNHEAVETIRSFFPYAIMTNHNGNFMSLTIAKYRCELVLKLMGDLLADREFDPSMNFAFDKCGNNPLHLAGLLAPTEKLNVVSGAALQMQKEVQWFKKIEKCMLPSKLDEMNKKGQTPIMMFREEHMNLRKEGEEWMKKASDSYTITAALIITIVFAAAITVPGGNDQNTGKPMFTTDAVFIIFAISDAISLFTSTTSLLLFLSILTARYHEDDFLYKLPKRFILGLLMLFISVTSMMVAFGATLYIMFGRGKEWILFPIFAFACLPIASYVILQYPLLHEMVSSTYGPRIYSNKIHKTNDRKNK